MIGNKCGKVKVDQNNWCGNFLFGTEKDQFVDRRAVVGWSWEPLCFLQIYRSINDTVQAIFVGVSVLMEKWPKNYNIQKSP